MYKNVLELVNALRTDYELRPLEEFVIKGIPMYSNVRLRFRNNRLQVLFMNLWKNIKGDFAEDIYEAMLHKAVEVYRYTPEGEAVLAESKGTITSTEGFEHTGISKVPERVPADATELENAYDPFKTLSDEDFAFIIDDTPDDENEDDSETMEDDFGIPTLGEEMENRGKAKWEVERYEHTLSALRDK